MFTKESIDYLFKILKINYTVKTTKKRVIYDFTIDPEINRVMDVHQNDKWRFMFDKEQHEGWSENLRHTFIILKLFDYLYFNTSLFYIPLEMDKNIKFSDFLKQGGAKYLQSFKWVYDRMNAQNPKRSMSEFLEDFTGIPRYYFAN